MTTLPSNRRIAPFSRRSRTGAPVRDRRLNATCLSYRPLHRAAHRDTNAPLRLLSLNALVRDQKHHGTILIFDPRRVGKRASERGVLLEFGAHGPGFAPLAVLAFGQLDVEE